MVQGVKIWMAAVVVLSLAGCASFQLSSMKENTLVDKTVPTIIKVTFCGNAYMTQKEVEKYAMQRACEEALAKGYSYFAVLNKRDDSKVCTLVARNTGAQGSGQDPLFAPEEMSSTGFIRPNITLTIQGFSEGQKLPDNVVDIQQFLDENFPGIRK